MTSIFPFLGGAAFVGLRLQGQVRPSPSLDSFPTDLAPPSAREALELKALHGDDAHGLQEFLAMRALVGTQQGSEKPMAHAGVEVRGAILSCHRARRRFPLGLEQLREEPRAGCSWLRRSHTT